MNNPRVILLRRVIAFGVDLSLLALYAGILFLFAAPKLTPAFHSSPFMAELLGFLLLTLPFVVYSIVGETSTWAGTVGKHIFQLEVTTLNSATPISFRRSALRTILKFLPWELAHFSIWNVFIFDSSLRSEGIACLALSYMLMATYGIGLLLRPHRTLYDRITGTQVRVRG